MTLSHPESDPETAPVTDVTKIARKAFRPFLD
jgi:hypothetical protein